MVPLILGILLLALTFMARKRSRWLRWLGRFVAIVLVIIGITSLSHTGAPVAQPWTLTVSAPPGEAYTGSIDVVTKTNTHARSIGGTGSHVYHLGTALTVSATIQDQAAQGHLTAILKNGTAVKSRDTTHAAYGLVSVSASDL